MPLLNRRILEVANISASSFYGKTDFLFGQCLAFAAERERRLLAGMPIRRLYLGTDRQDYVVNWTSEHDRRNVVLHAVGTADNITGYVFGMHLNYDPSLDGEDVEVDAQALGDAEKKPPFRRYARVWLEADYRAAARRQMGRRVLKADGLKGEIAATYDEAVLREDVEVADTPNAATRLQRVQPRGDREAAAWDIPGLLQLLPRRERQNYARDAARIGTR